MTRTLIFDSDGGVDDAQALLLLVGNGLVPDAITSVFGNVGLEAATANLLAVSAVAGIEVPLYKGADRPLNQPVIDAKYVHGEDGLGGAPRPAVTRKPEKAHAVDFLRQSFREAGGKGEKVDILMIGPLTNLALALRCEPGIVSGIGTLTIMGGTVHGRGNTTPAAEFNIYADPEAAAIVFEADIDIVLVPWEACVSHFIAGAQVDAGFAAAPDGPAKAFSEALARHARNNSIGRHAGDVLRYVDPLAAGIVLDPGIVRTQTLASIAVALAPGLTRGMTVIDPSGRLGTRKHRVVETVEIARMHEFYAASIAYSPSKA